MQAAEEAGTAGPGAAVEAAAAEAAAAGDGFEETDDWIPATFGRREEVMGGSSGCG
ncbi:hypothetical protein [Streptomyces sp. NPDC007063]|uniref:hypothetical protein n=1 Tax=Streptomyces sp. NPDC007063 TaxID=3364772 RepID=UPI0036D1B480